MAHNARTDTSNETTRWNAREIARRNRAAAGKPLCPVMKTAATASELAHAADRQKPGDGDR